MKQLTVAAIMSTTATTYLLAHSLHGHLFQICCFQYFLHNALQHVVLINETLLRTSQQHAN